MKTINWYPGHMKKTRELIESHLRLVDVCVEVCDARIPVSSRNPVLSELTAAKERVLILNKSDLADEAATRGWLEYIRKNELQKIRTALALNSMSGRGVSVLLNRLERIADSKAQAGTAKAMKPLRMMIVGIPNSGKSSLINRLTGRRSAQVGDRPGVTRGKQWLTLENGMQLLDTPGILWPKFEDPKMGLNLAFCGSIRDEIMDIAELGLELVRVLQRDYADGLAARYGPLTAGGDGLMSSPGPPDTDGAGEDNTEEPALIYMEAIARKRGFVLAGKRVDWDRTARTVLDEFRAGKIGRITLEKTPGDADENPGIGNTLDSRFASRPGMTVVQELAPSYHVCQECSASARGTLRLTGEASDTDEEG
jgi:ribosome biogenesis GTPase A